MLLRMARPGHSITETVECLGMSRQAIGVIVYLKTRAARRVNSTELGIDASDLMPAPSPLERRRWVDGGTRR